MCVAFGLPPSTLCRNLKQAEEALALALKDISAAKIAWPTKREQQIWGTLVEAKEPLVKNRFGFIDGKNYKVQKPSDSDTQNAYYNGWLHSTLVTNCLCFGVDGTIIWMKLNCPGSWNDAEMSRSFREKLLDPNKTLVDHGVLADSAFPVSGNMEGRIVTPLKDGDIERAHHSVRSGTFFSLCVYIEYLGF